jgi:murein DD-endopeptidase MepM/ murein hydrolase activator NlpD
MRRLQVPVALAVLLAAGVFAAEGRWPWVRLQVAAPIVVSSAFRESADTLQRGETIGDLFQRQGLVSLEVTRLAREFGIDTRRLRAGLVFSFRRPVGASEPTSVVVRTGPEERIRLQRTEDDAWDLARERIPWRTEIVHFSGDIGTSLYDALDHSIPDDMLGAGERVKLAWDLADVYAWNLDFTRDLQPGDRFNVVIERRLSEEGEQRYGRVLAAELVVGGRTLAAYRFGQGGESGFYDGSGSSLRRAFLRAPVQFRRISSTFSGSRFHPVLQIYRRHAGTDYAAAPGTPVMAAGEATVARAGWSGGYGIMVELRHRNGITTRYGHLRGLASGVRAGARVSQGEVIGYVGSTGLASGPHLHYEFLVNGVAQDARRIRLNAGPPIEANLRPAFEQVQAEYARLLATGSGPASLHPGD